ncbi:MAG: FtsX-like permease family protein [Gemmatimonadaceae bacterium]
MNLRLLGFATFAATATVLLFGVAPAWRATRVDAQSAMKAQGRGLLEGQSRWTVGKGLVVVQVALSLMLLVGAGLFLRTFRQLAHVNPGFEPAPVLLVDVDLRKTTKEDEGLRELRRLLFERVRAVPGVLAASTVDITPVSGSSWNEELTVDGYAPKNDQDAVTWFNEISDGFFGAMGTRMLSGRDFNATDGVQSPHVAIVNDAWARHFFGNASPLGREFKTKNGDSLSPPFTIIGVVENTKYRSMREIDEPVGYFPASQAKSPSPRTTLVLRMRGDPMAGRGAVQRAITSVHPSIVLDFSTLSQVVADSLRRERLLAVLIVAFGAVAALLAALGLYGVMAYSVARRRSELGMRLALGAGRERVIRMVLGDVTRVVGLGVVAGGVGAWLASRAIASLLYGTSPTDPWTYAGAGLLLAVAALLAGLVPAWRAASVDPMIALRE